MRNLTQKIVAVPVVLFLLVVLSAPVLTIHHVHQIEAGEPAGHDHETSGQTLNAPVSYHETHVVTLLSGDSFNLSTHGDVVPSLHKFIAIVAVVPALSGTTSLSDIAPVNIRPLSQISGDKCVLFCSFLI